VGKHKPTGTQWTHAQTIYTSRDANGTAYCVGMKEAGEHTRWTVQKAQVCADGFRHSFGFRAMHNDYTSPLVPCCILVALNSQLGSKETPFQRFAAGKECETSTEWRVVYKLVLLSRPIDDHTPRQRAPQDAPMWQRLNSMKAGSKRWLNDGLSSLKVFSAGDALETQACSSACDAPEDPEKRVRLFSEHWSRVSSRAISHPERVEVVRLPGSHGCGNISRPLPLLPAGLMQMRQLLPKLFSGHCDMGEVEDWAHKANFILVDLSTGQALLVGAGVQLVLPDSSRLSMEDGSEVEATRGTEHLLQAQRLSRWLRKLPDTHRGWIVVVDEALSVWQ